MFLVHVVGGTEEIRSVLSRWVQSFDCDSKKHDKLTSLVDSYDASASGCVVYILRPDHEGFGPVEELAAQDVFLPVIVVAEVTKASTVVEAMRSGAVDFVTYPPDEKNLIVAIERAKVVDDEWRRRRIRRAELQDRLDRLTQREREVLDLVSTGEANRQIATALSRSEKTIESHRASLMRKMEATSLAELVTVILEYNQIKLDLIRGFPPT